MTGYVLSPRAKADLDDIWEFTEATWNADQAEKYLRDIGQAFNTIAADPRRGQDAGDIRAGYRKYATGSHVIFYRVVDDRVDVVRILHARMDFGRHL